jgi:hypothetical protein
VDRVFPASWCTLIHQGWPNPSSPRCIQHSLWVWHAWDKLDIPLALSSNVTISMYIFIIQKVQPWQMWNNLHHCIQLHDISIYWNNPDGWTVSSSKQCKFSSILTTWTEMRVSAWAGNGSFSFIPWRNRSTFPWSTKSHITTSLGFPLYLLQKSLPVTRPKWDLSCPFFHWPKEYSVSFHLSIALIGQTFCSSQPSPSTFPVEDECSMPLYFCVNQSCTTSIINSYLKISVFNSFYSRCLLLLSFLYFVLYFSSPSLCALFHTFIYRCDCTPPLQCFYRDSTQSNQKLAFIQLKHSIHCGNIIQLSSGEAWGVRFCKRF